jgi:hypothetical protein
VILTPQTETRRRPYDHDALARAPSAGNTIAPPDGYPRYPRARHSAVLFRGLSACLDLSPHRAPAMPITPITKNRGRLLMANCPSASVVVVQGPRTSVPRHCPSKRSKRFLRPTHICAVRSSARTLANRMAPASTVHAGCAQCAASCTATECIARVGTPPAAQAGNPHHRRWTTPQDWQGRTFTKSPWVRPSDVPPWGRRCRRLVSVEARRCTTSHDGLSAHSACSAPRPEAAHRASTDPERQRPRSTARRRAGADRPWRTRARHPYGALERLSRPRIGLA